MFWEPTTFVDGIIDVVNNVTRLRSDLVFFGDDERLPVPGQQLLKSVNFMVVYSGEDIREIFLRIKVLKLCCLDNCHGFGKSFAAAIASGK